MNDMYENKKRWDRYFLNICNSVSLNSKCHSRQIGAILVRDKSIISTGYNGPPRGVPSCGLRPSLDQKLSRTILEDAESELTSEELYTDLNKCPRQILRYKSGQGLEWCIAGHAERNVLINAARDGIKTYGGTLYMNCGMPCTPCLVEIINAGISEIVVTNENYYDLSGEYVIKQSGLKSRLFKCHLTDSEQKY